MVFIQDTQNMNICAGRGRWVCKDFRLKSSMESASYFAEEKSSIFISMGFISNIFVHFFLPVYFIFTFLRK